MESGASVRSELPYTGSFHFWVNVLEGTECLYCVRQSIMAYIVPSALTVYHRLFSLNGSRVIIVKDFFIETNNVMGSKH